MNSAQQSNAGPWFGCHVSSAGGLREALRNGDALGVNTIQIHPSPPQRWNAKPFPPGHERGFLEALPESGVKRTFFHGIYLLNLATANASQLHLAKESLKHYLDLASRIGCSGVIFHVGSAKDHTDEMSALEQAAETINEVLAGSPNDGRLLLEVAAGSGSIIGDRLEELQIIYDGVDDQDRVGFALDTQHVWASGYDIRDKLEPFVDNVRAAFTLEKLWAIHLNDSMTDLGSRKDRHDCLGKGKIGLEALAAFCRHPAFSNIPLILETPALKELETAREDVELLRAIVTGKALPAS